MARLSALGVPPPPRPDAYVAAGGQATPSGAMQYMRDCLDWVQELVEKTDDHRKASVETIGDAVARHDEDLRREDERNPGWVAIALIDMRHTYERFVDQVAEDNAALLKDNQGIRSELKWMRGLALSALIAMLIFLGQQLYVRL